MTISNETVLVIGANHRIGQPLVEEAWVRGAKLMCDSARPPVAHLIGSVTPKALNVTGVSQIQRAVTFDALIGVVDV
jgi:NAD(P)-dependent dehydrogenase (short-subunit alcohol dehydrogenase family)